VITTATHAPLPVGKVPDFADYDPIPEGEMQVDPGIRRHVAILRAHGIETYQSCQGGEGHSSPEPMVRFFGNAFEGFKAFAIAMTYGLPVAEIRHSYGVIDGRLTGPEWEITFRTADPADAT
jgi:hypothetical protein